MATVDFPDCEVVQQTAKAICVNIPDVGETWVPQSQVDDASEIWKKGDEGTRIVAEWWAKREELI